MNNPILIFFFLVFCRMVESAPVNVRTFAEAKTTPPKASFFAELA